VARMPIRDAVAVRAKADAGRVRRAGWSGRRAGARRLPSADCFQGPSPKLPPLASLAMVKQSATVRPQSVLTHAVLETSQLRRPILIGAPHPARTRLCRRSGSVPGSRIDIRATWS